MNSQYVVAKFGGTSVADFEAMSRCAHIVRDNPYVRVVVVSACAGVTNHLVTLTQQKEDEAGRKAVVAAVENIQQAIIDKVSLDADLAEGYKQTFSEFESLASLPALSRQQCDEVLSFGERFSSYLFTQILRNHNVKASRF